MKPPRCPSCGAEMKPLPPNESRDKLEQCCGFVAAESFECLTEACSSRRIVTTRRSEGPFNPPRFAAT